MHVLQKSISWDSLLFKNLVKALNRLAGMTPEYSDVLVKNRTLRIFTIWAKFFYYLSYTGFHFNDILSKTVIHFVRFWLESYLKRDRVKSDLWTIVGV